MYSRLRETGNARTFLPVHDTVAAIAFVAQARGDDLSQSAALQRLVAWAAPRSSGAESLSVILRAVAVPEEGHYFPAAIQEGLLTLQLQAKTVLRPLLHGAPSPEAPPALLPSPPPAALPVRGEAPAKKGGPAIRRARPASSAARKQAAAAAGSAASSARHLAAASGRRARKAGSASAQAAQ
eukprot:s1708_g21.t1